jgi:hypothetical protein
MSEIVRLWWDTFAQPGLNLLESIGGPSAMQPKAQQLMLTIALQESGITHRAQQLNGGAPGPARGWWQFERGGGVAGVLAHRATKTLARNLCARLLVMETPEDVWRCIEGNDLLAAGFARLLLLSDPSPLPMVDDPDSGWRYYLDNWRPGKPHQSTWRNNWDLATGALS